MADGPPLVRSFVAVGAGFFAIQMLGWGADQALRALAPGSFDAHGPIDGRTFLIMLAYMAVLEAFGGYLTARLAIRRPVLHATILGLVLVAAALPFTVLTWHAAPAWYQIWGLLLILPMTILGSHIHEMLSQRGAHGSL